MLDQHMLLEDAEIITGFAERVTRRCGNRIAQIVCFEARAWGRAKPNSDYDLLNALAMPCSVPPR
jgi:hypothetical protein